MKKTYEKRFRSIEMVIVVIIISILIAVIRGYYTKLEFSANKNKLRYDLNNLNLISKLYKIKNGKYPGKIKDLYTKGYLEIDKNGYLNNTKTKLQGNDIIDIFGNPYIYDNNTGLISLNPKTLALIKNE